MTGRRASRAGRILSGLVGAVTSACAAISCVGSAESAVSAEPPPPLEVELSGCAEVWRGPTCELPDEGKLRIWVRAPREVELSVRAGNTPLAVTRSEVQRGAQLRVTVPAGARELCVTARSKEGEASILLALTPANPIAALSKAEALRRDGRFDEASAEVATVIGDPDVRVRARATGKAARLALARGDARRAARLFEEALPLDHEAGLISAEANDRTALAHVLLYNGHHFADVDRALAPLAALAASYPDARARAPYYEGQLARETGDLRSALRLFRAAEKRAERLGLDTLKLDAQTEQLDVLHTIGRESEGLRAALSAAVRSPETGVCKRAELLTNLGSSAIPREREEGAPPPSSEASELLEEAAELYQRGCPKPLKALNTLSDLALAELREGRADAARRHIEEARRAAPVMDARIEARLLDVEAHLDLARGDDEAALRGFDRLARIAGSAQLTGAELLAAIGKARALEALARTAAARAAYEEAEHLLDAWTRLGPVGQDRDAFVAGNNDQLSRHRVHFLMQRGTAAEAAEAARRSRSRSLASVQWAAQVETLSAERRALWYETLEVYRTQRDAIDAEAREDWKLPADRLARAVAARIAAKAELQADLEKILAALLADAEQGDRHDRPSTGGNDLPQPEPGELFLVYHPIRRGWVGFAITASGTAHHVLGALDPRAPAAQLAPVILSPFAAAVDAASRIRFLAYGALDARDLHALPWGGRPLIELAPVEYGLDIPGRVRRPTPSRTTALVVSNPAGTLPSAQAEGAAVRASLHDARGLGVERLDGRDATLASVQRALRHPDLDCFHYAGHAHFGEGEEESALSLADNGSLSVSDVLALPRAPRFVVLSGCETAGAAGDAAAQGLGLAQAFLVAGASAAVAATKRVDDDRTGRLMATFYGALATGDPGDAAAALRVAEIAERRRAGAIGGADCSSFRALVP